MPESLKYDAGKSDIFSLGVTLLQLIINNEEKLKQFNGYKNSPNEKNYNACLDSLIATIDSIFGNKP